MLYTNKIFNAFGNNFYVLSLAHRLTQLFLHLTLEIYSFESLLFSFIRLELSLMSSSFLL